MKKKDAAVEAFVEMFRRVKTRERGTRPSLLGLNDNDEKNFKKICARGYSMEQIEEALVAMFSGLDKWAVENKKDTVTHFLRQFDQYRNLADEIAAKKPEKEKPRELTQDEKEKKQRDFERWQWQKACMEQYTKSLKAGDWTGNIGQAVPIGKFFADSFTRKQKIEFYDIAKAKAADAEKRRMGVTDMRELALLSVETADNIFCEIVVTEAVKLKIKEPWNEVK